MSLQFTHVHSLVCRLKTLRNLPAHCCAVALCCVTITWQRIFKGSLQVTIVNALFRMWLLTSDIFDRWCSDTTTQWISQPNFFGGTKIFEGLTRLILGEQQYILGDTASQSKKWLLFLKVWGHGPLRDVVSYCVKRSMSESIAVLPHVWKIHYSVRCECDQCAWVNSLIKLRKCRLLSHSIKLRDLLDIPLWKRGLWAVPSPRGALVGLSPPNKAPTSQIEICNTIKSFAFKPPCKNV